MTESEQYNLESARNEADRIRQMVESGEAPNYDEAELLIDEEKREEENMGELRKYSKYFDILRRNDCSSGALDSPRQIETLDAQKILNKWITFKKFYDQIDLTELDENTGKTIIEENKKLIDRIDSWLVPALKRKIANPELSIEVPQEIKELAYRARQNMHSYGRLPAYEAYARTVWNMYRNMTREQWLAAGKPTRPQWFMKWLGHVPESKPERDDRQKL